MKKNKLLKVSIVMGSQSDYKTMRLTEKILKKIGVSFETKIISAHRTPKRMYDYALSAEKNNIGVIIAGAGGSAHLPGMISAITPLPVLGVPIESKKLKGLDSLLSIAINNGLELKQLMTINNIKDKNLIRSGQTIILNKPKDLYFIGDDNFIAITKYNRSHFYAKAVYDLSLEFK